jgi:hypothetical protein
MRIPHLVSVSFPPRDAHEKISSTCAKIPTISLYFIFSSLKLTNNPHNSWQKSVAQAWMSASAPVPAPPAERVIIVANDYPGPHHLSQGWWSGGAGRWSEWSETLKSIQK